MCTVHYDAKDIYGYFMLKSLVLILPLNLVNRTKVIQTYNHRSSVAMNNDNAFTSGNNNQINIIAPSKYSLSIL